MWACARAIMRACRHSRVGTSWTLVFPFPMPSADLLLKCAVPTPLAEYYAPWSCATVFVGDNEI